jgi:alpha-mannosidase
LPQSLMELSDHSVQLTSFKKAEKSDDYVIRLFEPTGKDRVFTIHLPIFNLTEEVSIKGYEIKTLLLDTKTQKLRESNLLEE